MKNLFNYATKELSQDAFLAWLFANCKCEEKEICDVANDLLNKFGIDTKQITDVEVKMQENKIDISVYITSNGIKQALFIEDKTGSKEHNQLIKYDNAIEKIVSNRNIDKVKKIYYKTFEIEEDERSRVKEAEGWLIIENNETYNFWKKYLKCKNQLLRFYAEYITEIEKAYNNTRREIPNDALGKLVPIYWKSYFDNVVIPKLNKEEYSCKVGITHYGYVCLVIRPKEKEYDEGYPYLEIRSRDCVDNKCKALILTYNLNEKVYPNIREQIKKEIKQKTKIGKETSYKVNNYKKQLAATATEDAPTDDRFIEMIDKYASEFCDIMEEIPR